MSARGLRRDRERTRRREARRRRRLALGTGAALSAAAFAAPAADATNYTVTNNLDDGSATTLREAIVAANNNVGPDDILFDSSVTGQITLNSQLQITDPVTIHGPGANALTVSGDYDDRVFLIDIGGDARETRGQALSEVTISGLSIAEGYLYAPEFGQARGAGILNENADLTVDRSRIHSNVIATYDILPAGQGGGIFSAGPLTLSNSEVSQNDILKYEGGGDRGLGGPPAGIGGGVYLYESSTISNSTISGNVAALGGGALANNEATTIDIENSTIAENGAKYAGGGIYRKYDESSPGSTNLISTIVGNNFAGIEGNDLYEQDSSATNRFTAAFSLISDTSDATVVETGPNILDQDPLLGDLGANGGPTQTHLPATNSPAIDKGISNGLTTDQRGAGFARTGDNTSIANAVGGDGTDIGAVELQVATQPPGPEPLTVRECFGETATIIGTTGKDTIVGTSGRDVIRGLRGNDTIKSLGGDDIVCGDRGVDKIRSGEGDDSVKGGDQGDRIRGGDGDDTLRGGNGADRIRGQDGNDQMFGGAKRGPRGGPVRGSSPGNVCDGDAGTDSAEGCETIRDVP